jgi:uncharacterized RDD family membrane protein YckC
MFQQYQGPNYATFGQRFCAYLIDSILMMIVIIPLFLIFGVLLAVVGGEGAFEEGTEGGEAISVAISLILNVLSIIPMWLYSAILESSVWQATIGKKIFGIRVTDLSGNRISFGRATGRYFGKYLSSAVCSIGFIMAAFTEKKQGLHDTLASTLVISGEGPPSGVTINHAPPQPPDFSGER